MRKIIFGLMISVIAFVSCTKEEVKKQSYDNAVYEEELAFINDDDDDEFQIIGGSIVTSNGIDISQNGIVYLLNNNSAVDMCMVTNGKYEFNDLEYKEYGLEFDINSYDKKYITSVFPQSDMRKDTIF